MVAKNTVHPRRQMIDDQVDQLELEDVLVADGHDHAILGLVELQNGVFVVAYSTKEILEGLVRDGMSYDEAQEYFDFNIKGAYVGPSTPVYIEDQHFEQYV